MEKTKIPGFYKVDESLVINTDNDALSAYKKIKAKDYRLYKLESELSGLKNDINEIKQLLRGIVK